MSELGERVTVRHAFALRHLGAAVMVVGPSMQDNIREKERDYMHVL